MDVNFSKIEIKSIDVENGSAFAEIYIDGNKLKGVRRFELKQEVGNNFPILTIDLNALNISVDSKVLLFQYGMSNITDISFRDTPNRDFIFSKISEQYGIDEAELRKRVLDEWEKENPSHKSEG